MPWPRIFSDIEKHLSNTALAALVVVLTLQVFFRYVLHTGLSWSEEISRFLFVGFVYISASYAVQQGTHIRVSICVDLLPARFGRMMLYLADGLWIAFNALVAISGLMLVKGMLEHPVYSTSLFIPLSLIYLVIPIAHILMIIRIIQGRFLKQSPTPEINPGMQA